MGIEEIVGRKRRQIMATAAKHGAQNVRVFGSVARGRATRASDVDFLVDMREGRTLLDLIGLSDDLEQILKRKVDVVTSRGLSPYLRDEIMAHAVPL